MNNTKSRETVKHTPGPWIVNPVNAHGIIPQDNPFFSIAAVSGFDTHEQQANRKLICSAPDLLEACKQAYYSMAKDGGKYIVMAPEKLIAMLESALEKAGAK